jgi:tetratricopeptide (TPR) repeat protein
MKTIILNLAFALLASSLATAIPASTAGNSAFEAARKAYDAGNFSAAESGYMDLLKAQPQNAALWYDLGNSYFKGGNLGLAIAAYQSAFDLRPRSADIRYNLSFALRKAGEELSPQEIPPILYYLFHFFSRIELEGLAWLACWATLLLGFTLLTVPSIYRTLKTPALAALALWIFFGAWWLARYEIDPWPLGVVKTADAEMRSGPGENFNVTVTVPEGRRAEILSDSAQWLEIGTLKEGARGWIEKSAVEAVQ